MLNILRGYYILRIYDHLHSSDFLDKNAKMLVGTTILKIGEKNIGRDPIPRHNKCSSKLKGTVLKDSPPY
jgi:hypothetical protein